MTQGGFVTLVGFVAREPSLRHTKEGVPVADVRIGAAARMVDRATGQWRDGEASYYTVNCWRRLADHAKASLRKGDPVVVKGRFRTHTFEDKQNRIRTEVEIVADTIGHDLSRGIANYIRPPERLAVPANDDLADGDVADPGVTGRDDPGEEGTMVDPGIPPERDPGMGTVLNEDAVSVFSRGLADDEAVARELVPNEMVPDEMGAAVPF
jgi:single-strand DNA-binding protein